STALITWSIDPSYYSEMNIQSIPIPDPHLSDDWVTLRPWDAADAYIRVAAGADPDIISYTSVEESVSLCKAQQWIEKSAEEFLAGKSSYFAILQCESQAVCGSMGFIDINWTHARAEIGYWILSSYRGQGIGTRALSLLANWGFTRLGFARLELLINIDNAASQRLAHNQGFQREGVLRSYLIGRHGREDMYIFSRLRGEQGEAI